MEIFYCRVRISPAHAEDLKAFFTATIPIYSVTLNEKEVKLRFEVSRVGKQPTSPRTSITSLNRRFTQNYLNFHELTDIAR